MAAVPQDGAEWPSTDAPGVPGLVVGHHICRLWSFRQPPNPTVVVTLALEAIAVFSAIFIILEMYRPIQRSVEHCAEPNSGRAECDGMLKHADSWYWHRQMSGV